jgi:hypothetical protein
LAPDDVSVTVTSVPNRTDGDQRVEVHALLVDGPLNKQFIHKQFVDQS